MQSLWSNTTKLPEKNFLAEEFHVENVVIGAGMAGILTAYFLQKQGKQVVVLDAAEMASGQTRNTTAKITSQHGLIYHDMIKKAGWERAFGYAKANEAAIKAYKEIIQKEGISCDFEMLPSFLYTTNEAGKETLKQEADAASKLGIKAYYTEEHRIQELPFKIEGAVCFEMQAQFHPLKFLGALSEKLTIYEHTKVLSVEGHMIVTDRGTIAADNIIFATHYPFPIIPGFFFCDSIRTEAMCLR